MTLYTVLSLHVVLHDNVVHVSLSNKNAALLGRLGISILKFDGPPARGSNWGLTPARRLKQALVTRAPVPGFMRTPWHDCAREVLTMTSGPVGQFGRRFQRFSCMPRTDATDGTAQTSHHAI